MCILYANGLKDMALVKVSVYVSNADADNNAI